MNGKLEVDAFWALQEHKSRQAALASLVEKGHPEIDAEAAITAAIADAKWEIRKKALWYFGLGMLVALIAPTGVLVTGYLSAKLTALSVVGAAVSLYGLLQMLFAVGNTVDTASD